MFNGSSMLAVLFRANPLTSPEAVKSRHVKNYDADLPSTRVEDNNECYVTDRHASHDASNSSPKSTLPIM